MKLQSVELRVPDVDAVARFFTTIWGLHAAEGNGGTLLRGTGPLPYLLSLGEGAPAILGITFCGPKAEIGGEREVRGVEGERYRFVFERATKSLPEHPDRPIGLSHVVLNSADADAAERFAAEKLGLKVSDRTKIMTFMRCNRKHHCIAYVRAGFSSLNHVAFDMPSLESVMRGIGRLRDAGYPAVWGPGRHGPGNNVFGYFIGPHGGVVEYTSEVSEVDESYRVGGPEDWKWPPGRIDHWGISTKDTARLSAAEQAYRWLS
jgi:catechol 2,3-dioxygenase-like lactoylglutathione lyase family enzyme